MSLKTELIDRLVSTARSLALREEERDLCRAMVGQAEEEARRLRRKVEVLEVHNQSLRNATSDLLGAVRGLLRAKPKDRAALASSAQRIVDAVGPLFPT